MALQDFFRMRRAYGNPGIPIGDPGIGGVTGYWHPGQDENQGIVSDEDAKRMAGPPIQDNTQQDDTPPPDFYAPPVDLANSGPTQTNNPQYQQTRDTDALRQLISQYPNREQYKPSILKRIGSGFIGVNEGSKAQQSYLDSGYDDAIADWKNQIAPAEDLANLERYGNTNSRQGLYQGERIDIMRGELERKTAQGNARIAQNQEKIDQNQQKIDHVLAREDISESEKLALTNKYRKEQIKLKGDIDYTRQQLVGTQQQANIGAKGEVDKDIQELRGTQRIEQIGATGAQARTTKATPSGGTKATSQSEAQKKIGVQNRVGQAQREHPEWSDWITIDPNTGQVNIENPSTGFFGRQTGPDDKTYKEMQQYFGVQTGTSQNDANVPSGAGTPNNTATKPSGAGTPNNTSAKPAGAGTPNKPATTPTSKTAKPHTTGKVRVKAPDGRTGTWDLSKGPVPKGFTEMTQ
jgi:hypothetical protein